MKIALTDKPDLLSVRTDKPSVEQLRNAAQQFEALLLMQITSALNASSGSEDGDDSLFGSDAGSGLAGKMFSEQMATTLSQSGGFGISDLIMNQITGGTTKGTGGIKSLAELVSSVKDLKPGATGQGFANSSAAIKPQVSASAVADQNDFQVVSTFEDDLRTNGIDAATNNLLLDGRVVNSTRARVVPGAPVVKVGESTMSVRSSTEISFQKPLTGRISSDFGSRFHPIDRKTKFHGGLDIAVPIGTPVHAAAEGTVTFAGRKGGYGNMVIVTHPDGRETRYAHLASISVTEGQPVGKGQPIANSGSTGKSTGPHLHFEVRENGRAIDPMTILSNVLPEHAEK